MLGPAFAGPLHLVVDAGIYWRSYITVGMSHAPCSYTLEVRFHFDRLKSEELRKNPRRGIGFEEAQEIFSQSYFLDVRNDLTLQYIAIGWVGRRLYSLIFEVREDDKGEFYHLVTLWKATREERELYEDNA